MLAVEVTYGFVWCPCCEKIERRKRENEPLPRCRECDHWMEPLLCDKSVEAVTLYDNFY